MLLRLLAVLETVETLGDLAGEPVEVVEAGLEQLVDAFRLDLPVDVDQPVAQPCSASVSATGSSCSLACLAWQYTCPRRRGPARADRTGGRGGRPAPAALQAPSAWWQ